MNTTNDIVVGVLILMMFCMTVYGFGMALYDSLKERYSKKEDISWEKLTDAKHVQ